MAQLVLSLQINQYCSGLTPEFETPMAYFLLIHILNASMFGVSWQPIINMKMLLTPQSCDAQNVEDYVMMSLKFK